MRSLTSRFSELYESLRPISASDTAINPDVTIVTAYVEIGEVPGDTESAFLRRSRDEYLEWMRAALSIRHNVMAFVEEPTSAIVREIRSGLMPHTVVETVDVDELRRSFYHQEVSRIIQGGYMRHATRPQRVELRAPLYGTIMFSKFDWMRRAIEQNPFGTRYFLWLDAGFGHGLGRRFRYRGVVNRVWPSPKKNHRMENTILVLGTGLDMRHFTPRDLMTRHGHLIAGGCWGGDRDRLLEFCDRFREQLCWTFEQNLLDDDQSVMSLVYMKYPELFTTIDCMSPFRDRCYFMKYLDASE